MSYRQLEQIFQNMIAFSSASELQTAQFLSENYDAFPSAAITTSSKFNSSCVSSVFPTFVLLCLAVSIAFHLQASFVPVVLVILIPCGIII